MKEDFRFYYNFRVRFAEVDSHRHVFNANYYTYFDTAITEYFRNLSIQEIFNIGTNQFHVLKTSAHYKAPVFFDEIINVYVRIAKLGNSSLTFILEIYGENDDLLRCIGEVIWINTDKKTRKSTPINDSFRKKILNYEKNINL